MAATPDAPKLDVCLPYPFYQHELLRCLDIVSQVGEVPFLPDPQLAVTKEDWQSLQRLSHQVSSPYVVLHPGSRDLRRRWPPKSFAAVGDRLATQGYQICITGTKDEHDTVEEVQQYLHHPAINLCGVVTLNGLTALLASATLCISNDTGPMHLAHAVGTPTVSIYWCVNYANYGILTRKRHVPLISWLRHCPDCGTDLTIPWQRSSPTCDHSPCHVASVSVTDVIGAVHELHGTSGPIHRIISP